MGISLEIILEKKFLKLQFSQILSQMWVKNFVLILAHLDAAT